MKRFLPLVFVGCMLCANWREKAGDNEPFTIDDYFELNRVTELALSSDGEMVAYAVASSSLEENRIIRTVFVSETTPGAKPIRIDKVQEARNLAWIPGTHELAYLLGIDGTVQVYSTDLETKRTRRHTNGDFPVTAFRFSPDGSSLAWLVQSNDVPYTLYKRLFHSDEGVVMDSEHMVVYEFVNPEWPNVAARYTNDLWLRQRNEKAVTSIRAPGKVKNFHWSSDAGMLSVLYVDNDIPHVALSDKYTSLGVYDVVTNTFESVTQARLTPEETVYYSGGEWIPRKEQIFIRRIEQESRWTRKTDWSVVNLSDNDFATSRIRPWHQIDTYGRDAEPLFLPVDENTIYSERTIRAQPSLYEITASGPERARIFENIDGAISSIHFSADFESAVFVNENLNRPPEIYIWRNGSGVIQLTHLNKDIGSRQFPRVKEVLWRSEDGVLVQGWLLEPHDDNGKPWPLITFVHGGPTLAFTNEFAMYFSAFGGIWSYPFEAYAINGMAVFIPNYRGTRTFGHAFANPSAIDGEPVNDITSGIEYLIAEGTVDPKRLAISGHSHGGWLAPLIMTKTKLFKAASFAEGGTNKIISYNLMPNWLNREVHDIQYGASLYDDPARYIELSPDMHFKGLDTAVLFEAGSESLAVGMMGGVKAALRAGMPAEFVVYPKTGHNLYIPRLQKEAAERNLDWFRFWLLDEEDPNPEKAEQYVRWRAMRDEQCGRLKSEETPSYCRQ